MDLVKLYATQQIEKAVDAIRADNGYAGWLPTSTSDFFLVVVDQVDFGMLGVQLVQVDKQIRWAVQVPYDTHDTVGYVIQRARAKAAL